MSRASLLLQDCDELFQQHYPYEKERQHSKRLHEYNFTTPGGDMRIAVVHSPHYPGLASVSLESKGAALFAPAGKGAYDITGAHPHDVQRVFSTVHHVIRDHLANNPEIKQVQFTAAEPSRKRLYSHLIKRFATTHRQRTVTTDNGSHDVYTINRDDVKQPI